jgi:hypothetical protein
LGVFFQDAFTDDTPGAEAFEIAAAIVLSGFPKADTDPFSLFPKRQDDVVDLSGGYFSNPPLGLWQIALVRFTDAAFGTPEGIETLADLGEKNGFDLDGTPLITTKSEIESLEDDGFVTIEIPSLDGTQGPRWLVCPVYEDPRDGAIAPDAFLEIVVDGNGNVLAGEVELQEEFDCLQATGDFCEGAQGCKADCSDNGSLDILDFVCFQQFFLEQDSKADCDDNGAWNVLDFVCFQGMFLAGCP